MVDAPSFVIAGAMRCGTTSLYAYLRALPGCCMSKSKEVHYFDRNYQRGPAWYRRQFNCTDGARAIGEATPNYLHDELARERLVNDLPEARLVILLRDPVRRAYSHYLLALANGRERLSFSEAIRAEADRLKSSDQKARAHVSYVDRGRYADQLAPLIGAAGAARVGVWFLEDLRADPDRPLTEIRKFIGLLADPGGEPNRLPTVNATRSVRSHRVRTTARILPKRIRDVVGRINTAALEPAAISVDDIAYLRGIYRASDERLRSLLNVASLPWDGTV